MDRAADTYALWPTEGTHRSGSSVAMFLFMLLAVLGITEFRIAPMIPGPGAVVPYLGELCIYSVTCFVLLRGCLLKRIILPGILTSYLILFFIFWGIMGNVMNGVNPVVAVFQLRMMIRFPLLFFIVANLPLSGGQIRRCVYVLLGCAAFEALLGIMQTTFPDQVAPLLETGNIGFGDITKLSANVGRSRLASGTLVRYNDFGAYMCFFTVFVFPFWRVYRIKRGGGSAFFMFVFFLCFVGLLQSGAGVPFWAALTSLLFLLFFISGRKVLMILVFGGALLVLSQFLLVVADPDPLAWKRGDYSGFSRLVSTFTGERLEHAKEFGRFYMHGAVLPRVLKIRPVVGLGLGAVGSPVTGTSVGYSGGLFPGQSQADRLALPDIEYAWFPVSSYLSDCGWLNLFAQTGLVGLLVYGVLLHRLMSHLFKLTREVKKGDRFSQALVYGAFGASFLYILIGIFSSAFMNRYTLQLGCMFTALAMASQRLEGERDEFC